MQYQCIEGQILNIEEDTRIMCQLKYSDETILLKLQPHIPLVNGRSFAILQFKDIKVGNYFKAYIQNSKFGSRKSSLEFKPSILVVNEGENFFAVAVGQFDNETNMVGNQVRTRINENAVIWSSQGFLKYRSEIFANHEVAVLYKFSTLSIPPQATPQLWIIL
ncbi:hypothetical protein ACIQ4I_01080 [Rummeliibacillus sp. NPDC094406]|uniref:hypothetical protein n=1 Tax=Rummeliibacillus sp. NPDC094406 TaxID=3364511 RepID=UPI0037F7D21B